MSSDDRLQRLRELLARIEQLPVTAESERMLREVRARVVDVDTGMAPRALLPVDPVPPAPEPRQPTARAPKSAYVAPRAPATRATARPPAPALSVADDREWLSLVAKNEILNLDDSAQLLPPGEGRTGNDRRPWTRGLRG